MVEDRISFEQITSDEMEHQKDLQRLRGFRPIDDDFMRGLFRKNIELVQFVLRIILDKKDLIITDCETQANMKRVTGARSICLDAYGTDSQGKKYDIEIQRADAGADPKRARYHSSVMDIENLDAGQNFKELPETYTIFITEKDFMGDGDAVYHYEMKNRKNKPLDDGAHIVYVNGEYRGDDEIGQLMHDFNCTSADEMHYSLMSERTKYLKENPEGVSFMCKAMEEMRNDTKIKTVIQLGKLKNLSNDQIIEDLVVVCNITKENAMKILGVQPA